MKIYRIAFIGHNQIDDKCSLRTSLDALIKEKITSKEHVEFYVGNNGDFNDLVSVSVRMVQQKVGNQNSSLMAVMPYHTEHDFFFERLCEGVLFPVRLNTDPEVAIAQRNRWMIDHTDLLVAYVEPNRDDDAATALKYAQKEGVEIINLARQE